MAHHAYSLTILFFEEHPSEDFCGAGRAFALNGQVSGSAQCYLQRHQADLPCGGVPVSSGKHFGTRLT